LTGTQGKPVVPGNLFIIRRTWQYHNSLGLLPVSISRNVIKNLMFPGLQRPFAQDWMSGIMSASIPDSGKMTASGMNLRKRE